MFKQKIFLLLISILIKTSPAYPEDTLKKHKIYNIYFRSTNLHRGLQVHFLTDSGVITFDGYKRSPPHPDADSLRDIPPKLGVVWQIEFGQTSACSLGTKGLQCWNYNGTEFELPNDIATAAVTRLFATSGGYCAQSDHGFHCWGEAARTFDYYSTFKIPEGLGAVTQYAYNNGSSCALGDRGLKCWGTGYEHIGNFQNTIKMQPPDLFDISKIYIFNASVCALTQQSSRCWGPEATYTHMYSEGSSTREWFDVLSGLYLLNNIKSKNLKQLSSSTPYISGAPFRPNRFYATSSKGILSWTDLKTDDAKSFKVDSLHGSEDIVFTSSNGSTLCGALHNGGARCWFPLESLDPQNNHDFGPEYGQITNITLSASHISSKAELSGCFIGTQKSHCENLPFEIPKSFLENAVGVTSPTGPFYSAEDLESKSLVELKYFIRAVPNANFENVILARNIFKKKLNEYFTESGILTETVHNEDDFFLKHQILLWGLRFISNNQGPQINDFELQKNYEELTFKISRMSHYAKFRFMLIMDERKHMFTDLNSEDSKLRMLQEVEAKYKQFVSSVPPQQLKSLMYSDRFLMLRQHNTFLESLFVDKNTFEEISDISGYRTIKYFNQNKPGNLGTDVSKEVILNYRKQLISFAKEDPDTYRFLRRFTFYVELKSYIKKALSPQ